MKARLLVTLAAMVILVPATSLVAAPTSVAGAKIDSGLAELPNYAQWLDPTGRDPMQTAQRQTVRVLGESLDDGLGELPHYALWLDKSGRDPMKAVRVLGESLDDGLGELPHYAKWLDKSGRDPMGRNGATLAAR